MSDSGPSFITPFHLMRITASLQSRIGLFLFSCLWLSGCAHLAYQHMNDPSRDAWQKPKDVVERLGITPGSRVADLGAGGGYFTWHLASAAGPQGRVYAVDIDETGEDHHEGNADEAHHECRAGSRRTDGRKIT